MAARMAFTSTSSLNGLVRNSTAPAFIARTLIGTSPYPVMKMIGMPGRPPSRPAGRGRSARQRHVEYETAGHRDGGPRQEVIGRDECFGRQPALLTSSSNDSRTDTSSSTTKTMGVFSIMVTTSAPL
jgi:hypothetical protein